jgi:predicted DNA-binding WGR domain protein
MALVASMHSTDITNDYNEGANCLKSYLRYAEAASIGDAAIATQILRTLSQPRTATDETDQSGDAVVDQLADALRERGYAVARSVGQSHFRCDLAVSRGDDRTYGLGILVDTLEWYAQRDLVERELLKPDLLTAFGWRIHVVLARDWYTDQAGVLERIERLLAGEELDEPEDEEELLPKSANAPTENDDTPPPSPTPSPTASAAEPVEPAPDEAASDVAAAEKPVQADDQPGKWSEHLEFVEAKSSKFWEITVSGNEQTVRFGRIGSRGQSLTKSFPDHESALADSKRQAQSKRQKGYRPKS